MSNSSNNCLACSTGSGGIGVFCFLGCLFVALKLTGFIDWSWWWVTLPFWGGFVLAITIVSLVFLLAFFSGKRRIR